MKLFWVFCGFRGPNFGDEYSQVIVRQISGAEVEHVDVDRVKEADICAVGSIAHLLPNDFSGYIWGTGIIQEDHQFRFPKAKIKAVRGKLTAKRLGIKDVPLGDPLLLLNKPTCQVKYELGILPHYVDFDDERIWRYARKYESVLVIDPLMRDAPDRIASCKTIISSSLHGCVLADAFGIPNQWTLFSDKKISGGGFKYRDYYSAFGIDDPIPYRWEESHDLNYVINRIEDNWDDRPLETIRVDLIGAFPKELRKWGTWPERSRLFAMFCAEGSSVLDIGSGQQTLKEFLDKSCDYQPCDLNGQGNALPCDFNANKYPVLSKSYDFVVCAGVLEYIKSPKELIEQALKMGKQLLLSYAIRQGDQSIESRARSGWVNHMTRDELENIFDELGLQYKVLATWQDQLIYGVRN